MISHQVLVVLIVVLIVLAVAGLPRWPYSAGIGWGYYPSGLLLALIVVVLLVLFLL